MGTDDGETPSWTSHGENRQDLCQDKAIQRCRHAAERLGGPTPHQNRLNPPQGHHTQKTKTQSIFSVSSLTGAVTLEVFSCPQTKPTNPPEGHGVSVVENQLFKLPVRSATAFNEYSRYLAQLYEIRDPD